MSHARTHARTHTHAHTLTQRRPLQFDRRLLFCSYGSAVGCDTVVSGQQLLTFLTDCRHFETDGGCIFIRHAATARSTPHVCGNFSDTCVVRVVDSARCTNQLHFYKEHSTLLCLMSQLYYNLNIKAVCPSGTFVTIYQSPRRYFPERHEVTCRDFLRPRSQLAIGLLKVHYFLCRSEIAYCLINRNSFPDIVRDLQLLRNVQTGARLHPAS